MAVLSQKQIQSFHQNGFVIAEHAVEDTLLTQMKQQFNAWVEDSRTQQKSYGSTIDGRPRFDLAPDHTQDNPVLRRVSSPTEISPSYYQAMAQSKMPLMVADLIGENVRFCNSKINSKLPSNKTEVKWHQDFPYEPHSNSDLITALLMLDDVTEHNGALEVVKGSHQGPIYSLWHEGIFTGAIAKEYEDECRQNSTLCTGKAGSVCLMHTRLLHGSAPNLSDALRTLFICSYVAGDALPLGVNHIPSEHDGLYVVGSDPGRVRCEDYEMELPEYPKQASFFSQQERTQTAD